jgi:hypothetical protein
MSCTSGPVPAGKRAVRRPYHLAIERLQRRDLCAVVAPGVALCSDTGSSATDAITSDGRLAVTAPPGALVRYSITPRLWTTAAPIPHEGLNTINVRRFDPVLGWSPARKIAFTLDTVAPRTPIISATLDDTTNAPLHRLDRGSRLVIDHAPKTAAFITVVDGMSVRIPVAAKGGASIAVAAVAPGAGPHVITVTVSDIAGNAASAEFSFVVPSLKATAARAKATSAPAATIAPAAVPPLPPSPLVPKSNPYVVNVKEYGAVGDNVTNDAAAIQAAWLAATLTGQPLYVPVGTYYVGTDQLRLSLEYGQYGGVTVYGDGVGRSIINCMEVKKSPQMLITCPTTPGDSVFLSMKGLGIFTKTTGVGVQFGAETYADPINEPELDLMVLNFDTSKTAVAVEINYVLNGDIRLVANTAGAGTSLLLRQASFNHFTGSYGGVGGVAVRLADGFNDGNVFTALDMENVATCVVSTSPRNFGNTFVGGTWSYTRNGVVSTSGRRLVIINPHLNPPPPGKLSGFLGAAVGVVVWPSLAIA